MVALAVGMARRNSPATPPQDTPGQLLGPATSAVHGISVAPTVRVKCSPCGTVNSSDPVGHALWAIARLLGRAAAHELPLVPHPADDER